MTDLDVLLDQLSPGGKNKERGGKSEYQDMALGASEGKVSGRAPKKLAGETCREKAMRCKLQDTCNDAVAQMNITGRKFTRHESVLKQPSAWGENDLTIWGLVVGGVWLRRRRRACA